MSRRGIRGHDASVSLFPFLAVLICTMGALIVLLVIVVQQARTQAHVVTTDKEILKEQEEQIHIAMSQPSACCDKRTAEIERLNSERDDLIWQADLLAKSREKTRQRLREARLKLSHLEHHAGELEQTLEKLKLETDLVVADQDKSVTQARDVGQQIQELDQEINIQEAKFQQLQANRNAGPVYAIVPYQGPQGTSRRPLYIECTENRVVLQPEGIELVSDDFNNADDPSNALAAVIRAAREYFVSTDPNGNKGDAYPLLIVRPSGASAYIASRAAMQSWDDEFGYELVTADMELSFPPADPALAKILKVAVDHARNQRIMLESWEAREETELTFEASRNGGFIASRRDANGLGNAKPDSTYKADSQDGASAFGTDANSHKNTSGFAHSGPSGSGPSDGGSSDHGPSDDSLSRNGNELAMVDDYSTAGGSPDAEAESIKSADGDQTFSTSGTAPHSLETAHESDSEPNSFGNNSGKSDASDEAGDAGEQVANSSTRGHLEEQATATSLVNASTSGSSQTATTNGSFSEAVSFPQQGLPQPSIDSMDGEHDVSPLAGRRGSNWALPNAASGSIAITRPLKMVFEPEGVRLPPESGTRQKTRFVPWANTIRKTVDPVVEIVWQRIENWGIAGSGVYWQPILEVAAEPAMNDQVEQFQALLENSGLELIRR